MTQKLPRFSARLTNFEIVPKHLWIFVIVVCLSALIATPKVTGDGLEYIAMTKALGDLHLPSFSLVELEEFHEWTKSQFFTNFIGSSINNPILVGFDGRQDFYHFWFYSLLAVPFVWTLKLFNLPLIYSFTLLNISTLLLAARIGLASYSSLTLCLILSSPIIWYTNKAHTEIFTFSMVLIGMALISRKKFLFAATPFAVASTQNVPWIPLVFILCMVSIIQESLPLRSLLFTNDSLSVKKILPQIRAERLFSLKYLMLIFLNLSLSLIHPIYYWIRLKVMTPTLLGTVESKTPNLTTYFAVLIDPDVGLLPNWPFQTLFALLVLVAFFIPHILLKIIKRNKSFSSQDWEIVTLNLFSLFLLFSFAKTTNVNHGGTLSISRYALWLIPVLVMPYLEIGISIFRFCNYFHVRFVHLACPIVFVIYLVLYSPFRTHTLYTYPTFFSKTLYDFLPCIYQPVPEIFVERNLHQDGIKIQSVSNHSCSLSFIKDGVFPNSYSYTRDEKVAVEKSLEAGASSSWIVRSGKLNLCKPKVISLFD